MPSGSHDSTPHLRFLHLHSLPPRPGPPQGQGFDICGVEIVDAAIPVDRHPFRRSTAFLLGNEVRVLLCFDETDLFFSLPGDRPTQCHGRDIHRAATFRRTSVEMVGGRPVTGNLDFWFRSLMVADGRGKMDGAALNGWKDLPMELLLRIVSRGNDCTFIVASGVCTGWREVLCTGLTHLSLSWCKENMNNLVLSLAPKFTKLQSIYLRQNKPQLEDNAIEAIANQCHDLRDLDLSKSHGLSDRSLYALAHGCPCLTKLNISGCSAFSDSALAYLTGFCKNLKNLNLCGCVKPASDSLGGNRIQLPSIVVFESGLV